MANEITTQIQPPSLKDTFFPPVVVFVVWLLLHITYDLLGIIESVSLYRSLASINWVLLVISVGFSSVVIYPIVYFRGATVRLRIIAIYFLPLAWCIKEFIRVSATVTGAEAIFYVLFTPVQLLIIIGQAGLMGILELVCRMRHQKQDKTIRVVSLMPVLAILVTVIFLYLGLLRGGGYDFHLMIKMVYRTLFL